MLTRPPPSFAERIPTPGAARRQPVLEKVRDGQVLRDGADGNETVRGRRRAGGDRESRIVLFCGFRCRKPRRAGPRDPLRREPRRGRRGCRTNARSTGTPPAPVRRRCPSEIRIPRQVGPRALGSQLRETSRSRLRRSSAQFDGVQHGLAGPALWSQHLADQDFLNPRCDPDPRAVHFPTEERAGDVGPVTVHIDGRSCHPLSHQP